MDTVESGVDELTRVLKETAKATTHFETSLDGMQAKVREMNHQLANNTMVTDGTAAKARESAALAKQALQVNESILSVVQGLDVINKLSRFLVRIGKPIVLVAGMWAAAKAYWK